MTIVFEYTFGTKVMTTTVGIIGTGFGAKVHLPGFLEHPNFEVKLISGRNPAKTKKIADEAGISATTDWTEIIRSDVDLVAVTTPPFLHYEMAKATLLAEKHLLLEKPTTQNATQAKELASMAINTGVVGMISHEFRWTPSRNYFADLINTQEVVGEIREVHYHSYASFASSPEKPHFGWLWDTRFEGGMLGALGSHLVDQIRHTTGMEFSTIAGRVSTVVRNRRNPDGSLERVTADDGFSIIGHLDGEVVANISASTTISPSLPSRFVVSGSENTVYLEGDKIFLGEEEEYVEVPIPENFLVDTSLADVDRRLPPFMKLLDQLHKSIDQGTSLHPNLTDGWRNQQVLDAVRDSHRTGSYVNIFR